MAMFCYIRLSVVPLYPLTRTKKNKMENEKGKLMVRVKAAGSVVQLSEVIAEIKSQHQGKKKKKSINPYLYK